MNKKGFTLVEVLVVIAIISILLLVLVPNVFVMINKNNEKACNSLVNNIESAAKIYVTNNKYNMNFGCETPENIKQIALQTLINSGDLQTDSTGKITNPINNKEISPDNTIVNVTYNCTTREFSYKVEGIDCRND